MGSKQWSPLSEIAVLITHQSTITFSFCRLFGSTTTVHYFLLCSQLTRVIIPIASRGLCHFNVQMLSCGICLNDPCQCFSEDGLRNSQRATLCHCFFPPHQTEDFWYFCMAAPESYQLYVWTGNLLINTCQVQMTVAEENSAANFFCMLLRHRWELGLFSVVWLPLENSFLECQCGFESLISGVSSSSIQAVECSFRGSMVYNTHQ